MFKLKRTFAFILDNMITFITWLVITGMLSNDSFEKNDTFSGIVILFLLFTIIYSSYYFLLEYYMGYTFGKYVFKIRIIIIEGKEKKKQILFRTLYRFHGADIRNAIFKSYSIHEEESETRTVPKNFIPPKGYVFLGLKK